MLCREERRMSESRAKHGRVVHPFFLHQPSLSVCQSEQSERVSLFPQSRSEKSERQKARRANQHAVRPRLVTILPQLLLGQETKFPFMP